MKELSLIILTYNSEKDIYDCLYSVYQHNDIGNRLEIIIVDNNSDGYVQMHDNITSLYPNVIIIPNTKNGGYGQGNNIGIQAATAPIIAIMNPDIRLVMPVFQEMLNVFDNKQTVMCGGKQYKNATTPAIIDNARTTDTTGITIFFTFFLLTFIFFIKLPQNLILSPV